MGTGRAGDGAGWQTEEVLLIRVPPQWGGRVADTWGKKINKNKTGTEVARRSPDFCSKRLGGGWWRVNRETWCCGYLPICVCVRARVPPELMTKCDDEQTWHGAQLHSSRHGGLLQKCFECDSWGARLASLSRVFKPMMQAKCPF